MSVEKNVAFPLRILGIKDRYLIRERTEELLLTLKRQCTLIMVSHYQEQVTRISDEVLHLDKGSLFKVKEAS